MSNPVTEGIEKLLTVHDVMDTLRISRPTLYRMLKAGQLRPVRIGKRTLFDPADIRALIEGAKTGGKPRPSRGRKTGERHPASAAPGKKEIPPAKEAAEKRKAAKKKPPDDADKQGRLL